MTVQAAIDELLTFTDPDEVGGQTFKGYPADGAEVGEFWSFVFFEALATGLVTPVTALPALETARVACEGAIAGFLATPPDPLPPVLGAAALDAGALAFFGGLGLAIVPNLIAAPPTLPFIGAITAEMAPFLPTTDAVDAAGKLAASIKSWIESAMWTIPGPPSPQAFELS